MTNKTSHYPEIGHYRKHSPPHHSPDVSRIVTVAVLPSGNSTRSALLVTSTVTERVSFPSTLMSETVSMLMQIELTSAAPEPMIPVDPTFTVTEPAVKSSPGVDVCIVNLQFILIDYTLLVGIRGLLQHLII